MASLHKSAFQSRTLAAKGDGRSGVSSEAATLQQAAVDALLQNFEKNPSLQGIPGQFAEIIAERLPLDFDVRLTVPNVHNELYYRRLLHAYGNAWGQAVDVAHHGGSYKQAFCELYVAHLLERFGEYEHPLSYESAFHRPPIDGTHPLWPVVYPKAATHRIDGLPARERSCAGASDGLDLDSKILSSPDSGWPYLETLKAAIKRTMPSFESAAAWTSGVDRAVRLAQAQAQIAAGTTVPAAPPAPAADPKASKDPKGAAPAGADAGLPAVPAILTVPYTQLQEEEKKEKLRMCYARDDAFDCGVDNPGQYLREWVEPEELAAWRSTGAWPDGRGDSLLTTRAKELTTLLDRIQACEDWIFNLHISALPSHLDLELVVSRLPNLTHLSLSYGAGHPSFRFDRGTFGVTVKDMDALGRVLRATDCLTSLSLPSCGIDDGMLASLVQGLLDNGTVTHLNLAGNAISGMGAEWLAKLLRGGAQGCVLASLDLGDNPIGVQGGRSLGKALRYNDTLTHLLLKQADLKDEGMAALLDGLARGNKVLTRLILASNGGGKATAAALSGLLASSACPLEVLDISNNDLSEADMAHIAAALSTPTATTYLAAVDCRGNPGCESQAGQEANAAIQGKCRRNEAAQRGGLSSVAPAYTAVVASQERD